MVFVSRGKIQIWTGEGIQITFFKYPRRFPSGIVIFLWLYTLKGISFTFSLFLSLPPEKINYLLAFKFFFVKTSSSP